MIQEKDVLQDMLFREKELVKLYGTMLIESSCTKLRGLLQSNMTECAQDQYEVYELMSKKGLYTTKNAPPDEVNTAKTKFAQCQKSMR